LFLSPEEYQRESAWGQAQKLLLIDTIFQGMDIPKFYLWKIDDLTLADGYPDGPTKQQYREILDRKRRENDDPRPFVYEVVDGQQRIRTILEFIDAKPPKAPKEDYYYRGPWHEPFNSLAETPIAKGKPYRALNAEQKIKFGMCPLTIMILENATISEVRDMFLRLQNGTPLNAQQKRDATGSLLRRHVREIAALLFFATSVNFRDESGEHRRVASQMLLLEYKEKIVSSTSQQLDKFYENYGNVDLEHKVVVRAKAIVGMLGEIFPARNPALNRSYALGLYWCLSRILLTYEIKDDAYPLIRANFEGLDQRRLEAMNREYNASGDELYQRLSDSMSRGTNGSERITTRYEILTEYFFDGIHLIPYPQLDPNRNFTYEEKLISIGEQRDAANLNAMA
jgi:Protein of unknown function DUF262